jgi:hypothetical protein
LARKYVVNLTNGSVPTITYAYGVPTELDESDLSAKRVMQTEYEISRLLGFSVSIEISDEYGKTVTPS